MYGKAIKWAKQIVQNKTINLSKEEEIKFKNYIEFIDDDSQNCIFKKNDDGLKINLLKMKDWLRSL